MFKTMYMCYCNFVNCLLHLRASLCHLKYPQCALCVQNFYSSVEPYIQKYGPLGLGDVKIIMYMVINVWFNIDLILN
jgi:hypothetical protein